MYGETVFVCLLDICSVVQIHHIAHLTLAYKVFILMHNYEFNTYMSASRQKAYTFQANEESRI